MKVKLKFDKRSIQEFLILNVEKIFAGVVVFGTLLILYLSVRWYGNEKFSFDRTPALLQSTADNARTTIEQTPVKTLEVTDFVRLAEHIRVPVVEKPYDYANLWDRPLFEQPALRGEPPVLAARQLRGIAEFGTFRVTTVHAPAGTTRSSRAARATPGATPTAATAVATSEDFRGKPFVVLTALVPVADQETAYIDTFSSSVYKDPANDVPRYFGYWVQRVELTSPADAANPPWEKAAKFNLNDAKVAALTEWMGPQGPGVYQNLVSTDDVVPPDVIDPYLTFPLGRLVNRRWNASVAHEPEIPVQKAPLDSGYVPEGAVPGDQGMRPGVAAGAPLADENPFGPDVRPIDPERAVFTRPPGDTFQPNLTKKPFKLLRFFDFNVEPGKQYMYRVQLVLENPNRESPTRGVKRSFLKDPLFADKKYLETKWSDPTPPIAVPLDWHVFLLAVNPAPKPGAEPSSQLMVTKWKPDKGIEFNEKFQVVRGQLVVFSASVRPPPGSVVPAVASDDSIVVDPEAPVTAAPRRLPPVQVDFVTDVTALDFRGGERFRRKGSTLTVPGELLLMDARGNLSIHNELDDNTACDRYLNPPTEPKKTEPAAAPPAKTALDASRR